MPQAEQDPGESGYQAALQEGQNRDYGTSRDDMVAYGEAAGCAAAAAYCAAEGAAAASPLCCKLGGFVGGRVVGALVDVWDGIKSFFGDDDEKPLATNEWKLAWYAIERRVETGLLATAQILYQQADGPGSFQGNGLPRWYVPAVAGVELAEEQLQTWNAALDQSARIWSAALGWPLDVGNAAPDAGPGPIVSLGEGDAWTAATGDRVVNEAIPEIAAELAAPEAIAAAAEQAAEVVPVVLTEDTIKQARKRRAPKKKASMLPVVLVGAAGIGFGLLAWGRHVRSRAA